VAKIQYIIFGKADGSLSGPRQYLQLPLKSKANTHARSDARFSIENSDNCLHR
jgi:hypothetical protein